MKSLWRLNGQIYANFFSMYWCFIAFCGMWLKLIRRLGDTEPRNTVEMARARTFYKTP